MNYGPKIVTNGLVLALDAADKKSYAGSGTAWNDLSGNNNNGTLVNGPTFSSANGGSIVFDGVNDYVSTNITTAILSPSSNFSIICWAYINISLTGLKDFVYLGNRGVYTPNNNWIGLAFLGSTIYVGDYVNPADYSLTFTVPSTGWYQVAQIRNGANHFGFLNAVQRASGTYTNTSINAASTLRIGNSISNVDYMNGNIAIVQIYNKALTAAEISQNFNATRGRFGI